MNYSGVNKEKLPDVISGLNQLLADYHIHYQKLRNFHWNLKGDKFFTLHPKFEEMYEDVKLKIDEVAERILTLRHRPLSLISEYMETAKVKESPSELKDYEMVDALIKDIDIIIGDMRVVIEAADEATDEGTIDMIGGFLSELEKTAWMLAAYREHTPIAKSTVNSEVNTPAEA